MLTFYVLIYIQTQQNCKQTYSYLRNQYQTQHVTISITN